MKKIHIRMLIMCMVNENKVGEKIGVLHTNLLLLLSFLSTLHNFVSSPFCFYTKKTKNKNKSLCENFLNVIMVI